MSMDADIQRMHPASVGLEARHSKTRMYKELYSLHG